MRIELGTMTALAALLTAVSAPALATEAVSADGGADADQRTIVVTGVKDGYAPRETSVAKIPAELRDLPQAVNVVPEEVLRDQRALSVQDALKNVPGVGMSHGDGQRDQVTIRGFSAISDQFVDGFRDDALYFRDLSNVARIEVIKGPAAVLYGRGSSDRDDLGHRALDRFKDRLERCFPRHRRARRMSGRRNGKGNESAEQGSGQAGTGARNGLDHEFNLLGLGG